jgi:heavy metal translocating P-type ATPase
MAASHSKRSPASWLLALATAGIVLGSVARLAGLPGAAAAVWGVTTAAILAPLTLSVARSLRRGALGVDLIALLAMAGALLLQQYLAGAVIALMLAGGGALEEFAQSRAQRELSALLQRAPQWVHRYEDGALTERSVQEVRRGDLLLVKPGEMVPVDGVVVESTAVLDQSALTGEAAPVSCRHGEQVRSGAVNAAGTPFTLRAISTAEDSTYAGIIRLVEQAQQSKAPLTRLADRYAIYFLPLTLAVAGGAWIVSGDAVRALAVLVVATPCPLILAAPVAIVAGVSRAARRGIIVKGGAALETLARGRTLVLDKTGTVTAGTPALTNVESFGAYGPDELLRLAASLDQVSPHVLAAPILRAANERGLALRFPEDVREELGAGIRGRVDGLTVALGKSSWVLAGQAPPARLRQLQRRLMLEGASGVFVAVQGALCGALILEDPIRRDAPITLRALRRVGFDRIALLTGDHADVAKLVGGILGVDQVFAERSPAEKVEVVAAERKLAPTVMVGDGINDAPALAAADTGVAMGARGATASSQSADVVLMVDRLDRLGEAVRIARRSRHIALESIWAGMGLSLAAMGFAAGGWLPPVAGAILQEVIDVVVILNALRALRGAPSRELTDATIALGDRFRAEHERLQPGIKRIRRIADQLDLLPPAEARRELAGLHRFLAGEVMPHEQAEDATVYPAVAKLIGGEDPTAVMSRAHLEISHLVTVLGRYLEDMVEGGPTADEIREIRPVLYGLDSVLRLHFAQEDESYLALIETRGSGPAGA